MSYNPGAGPYYTTNYPSGQGTQYQPQNAGIFGSQNRQDTQGSYIRDSPKKTIFGGAKGDTRSFYDDYVSGAPSEKRSPPRTLASNFQTKPSNIVDFDNIAPERRSPGRSVTPNYATRNSGLGNEYQLRINDARPSNQEPVFANPLFAQPAGSFSREHTERNYKAGSDLEIKKNLSQKALSVTHSEHRDQPSVKPQQLPPHSGAGLGGAFRGLGIAPTSSTGPLPRPSTVVQMDPSLKYNQPTQKVPYFSDKRVVITGASSGIGRAISMWFLNSGARVALIGRDLESLINVGKQFPHQALVIKCDLAKDDQPYDTYSTILAEFHGIDILINAAGVMREGDIKTMLPQDFDNIMDVNLRSMFYLSYLFFPELQKSRGSIINLSCQYGTKPFAGLYAYCMSKAGVEALTKHLAHEFATSGVRVNAVAPGLVETNLLAYRKLPQGEINDIYSNAAAFTPLKRIASIDDVGKAIVFLCSEAAGHITGQVLRIDGGRHLTSSGWHQWEGQKATGLILESKESIFNSLKGKILHHSNSMMAYNEKDKIGFQIKQSSWSTADHQAHAAIKYAKYHEQDVRHDPQVSVIAMENTFQKIFQ